MQRRYLKMLAVATASLGLAAQPAPAKERQESNAKSAKAAPASFSEREIHDFLDKARRAEAMSDPLKRCLAYPDPPGSHWSAATTQAYCTYRVQAYMPYEDFKALIDSGKAAQFDAYLSEALKQQLTRKESAGLLDHIYFAYFVNTFGETRATIDAWQRQRPNSAFAFAASGRFYLAMAWSARGTEYASDTSSENFQRMNQWIELARKDLERAVALDPRVLPAYTGMINIGMALGDRPYAKQAARKGLAVQPANYSIYAQLFLLAEPKWGGSPAEMKRVAEEARAHAKDNELLKLVLPLPGLYAASHTDPGAFDQLHGADALSSAAYAADSANLAGQALVYQSEVLRFNAWADMMKAARIRHLIAYGEKAWGKADADALAAKPYLDPAVLASLPRIYMTLGDKDAAMKIYARLDELDKKSK